MISDAISIELRNPDIQIEDNLKKLLTSKNCQDQTIIIQRAWNIELRYLAIFQILSWQVIKLVICYNQHPPILKQIKSIDFNTLITLEISFNKIESIEALAYLQAPILTNIFMDNNQIMSLRSMRKIRSRKIQQIFIENNRILQWPQISEGNWKKLSQIGIEGTFDKYQCGNLRSILKAPSKYFQEIRIRAKDRIFQKQFLWSLQIKNGLNMRLWTNVGQLYDPQQSF